MMMKRRMITIVMMIVNNKNYGGDCDHPRQVEEERLHKYDDVDNNNALQWR